MNSFFTLAIEANLSRLSLLFKQIVMANFHLMPSLPEFQLNLTQGDEEDDAEEEKNMMNILMKLKNAQSSMHESKKR